MLSTHIPAETDGGEATGHWRKTVSEGGKKGRILRALVEVQRSCSGERKCVIKFTGSAEQVITELIKQEFLTQ